MIRFLIILTVSGFSMLQAQRVEPQVEVIHNEVVELLECLNSEFLVLENTQEDIKTLPPLIIYLHGAGGKGTNIKGVKQQLMRFHQAMAKHVSEPCLIVAPQCLAKTRTNEKGIWQPKDLDQLLGSLKANRSFDLKRVYLTGTSMGGYGTWVWAQHSPQHFAAIAPVVGGLGKGGPKDITLDLEKWAKNLAETPVWAFHGATDRVVPVDRSEQMIKLIRKHGNQQAKLTIYPDEGHGAGRKAYADAGFYKWLLGKTRP